MRAQINSIFGAYVRNKRIHFETVNIMFGVRFNFLQKKRRACRNKFLILKTKIRTCGECAYDPNIYLVLSDKPSVRNVRSVQNKPGKKRWFQL